PVVAGRQPGNPVVRPQPFGLDEAGVRPTLRSVEHHARPDAARDVRRTDAGSGQGRTAWISPVLHPRRQELGLLAPGALGTRQHWFRPHEQGHAVLLGYRELDVPLAPSPRIAVAAAVTAPTARVRPSNW